MCREDNVKINRHKNYLKVETFPENREVVTHGLLLHDEFPIARPAGQCQEQYCEILNFRTVPTN